jgi:hypothetical protein
MQLEHKAANCSAQMIPASMKLDNRCAAILSCTFIPAWKAGIISAALIIKSAAHLKAAALMLLLMCLPKKKIPLLLLTKNGHNMLILPYDAFQCCSFMRVNGHARYVGVSVLLVHLHH